MDDGDGGGVGQFARIGHAVAGGVGSSTVKKRSEVVTPAGVTTLSRLVTAA